MHQLQPLPQFRELLEQLYRERTLTPFATGMPIPLPEEVVAIVCRGVVQLSAIHDNGDETLLGLAGPSAPIGLPLTVVDPYQAHALSPVDILYLPLAEIEASNELAAGLCRQMMARLRQAEAWLALSGKRPVSQRLRHLLTLLADDFGQEQEGRTRIAVRLTHQQLANAIGTTRVTVTRLLSAFRKENWLVFDPQRHIVVDRARLEHQSWRS
ncbi:Crp/Fnr family transcriptional regulator [Synechococcus sp. PCC 7336]|uniref:Crp/Fnr family transcriptional regulator n=1 Tax=Synechococcus sp. PCC 7336 TaxID=195250 RepID=UPI0003488F40|nr:helix-turn-helix domain-containing protein [Synechococcus sp. PCC 7336]